MDNNINNLFNPLFNEIENKCCFSIQNQEKNLIENFIKKLIYTYINASIKIINHCKKKMITLSDIKLADEFINDETIMISTEVNEEVNEEVNKKINELKNKDLKKEKYENKIIIKSIDFKFTKKITNKLIKNIDKHIEINDNALKFLNKILLKFSKSFFDRCENHCKIKKEKEKTNKVQLDSNDIYYILIH